MKYPKIWPKNDREQRKNTILEDIQYLNLM